MKFTGSWSRSYNTYMKVYRVECVFQEMMEGYYIDDLLKMQKGLPDNEMYIDTSVIFSSIL